MNGVQYIKDEDVKDQKLNRVFKSSKGNQRKCKRLQELEREFSE